MPRRALLTQNVARWCWLGCREAHAGRVSICTQQNSSEGGNGQHSDERLCSPADTYNVAEDLANFRKGTRTQVSEALNLKTLTVTDLEMRICGPSSPFTLRFSQTCFAEDALCRMPQTRLEMNLKADGCIYWIASPSKSIKDAMMANWSECCFGAGMDHNKCYAPW